MRNCNSGDFPKCPHDAVDTCKVFWHEEDGTWYHEESGRHVDMYKLSDGTMFDVQAWLTNQAQNAMNSWKPWHKVHEKYRRHKPKTRPATKPAIASAYSNEFLDKISDEFIRSRDNKKTIEKRIAELNQEIAGFSKISKKWGSHPILKQRIQSLKDERDDLSNHLTAIQEHSSVARIFLKNEHEWTKRWVPIRGKWSDFVFVCEDKFNRMWVIDRNGLKMNSDYLYLPTYDHAYEQSMAWAHLTHGINPDNWQRLSIPADSIGVPIRRYGKKNANGRRISARADQKKYAEVVLDLVKQLKLMHVDINDLYKDEELVKIYKEKIAPRLSHK